MKRIILSVNVDQATYDDLSSRAAHISYDDTAHFVLTLSGFPKGYLPMFEDTITLFTKLCLESWNVHEYVGQQIAKDGLEHHMP